MDIAIYAPISAFSRIKKLAKVLKFLGLGKHNYTVFCHKATKLEIANAFDGLSVELDSSLVDTLRSPPMDANDPFSQIASKMTKGPWFFLSSGTIPVREDWADVLESELHKSGKSFVGAVANTPKRYLDNNGIPRVSSGEPYILEAAVYPANLPKLSSLPILNRSTHHEVFCRTDRFPKTFMTDSIQNAELDPNFRRENIAKDVVVVTRLFNDAVADQLIGDTPLPVVLEKIVVKPAEDAAPQRMELKPPTIKVFSSAEDMAKSLENLDSPKSQDEVTVEPKRVRGRPRKVPALP